MKYNNEIKIGIIVVAGFFILIWGFNFLKGVNILNPSNSYISNFNRIDGLAKSAPVTLDGFKVGVVNDIEYQYNNPGNIIVELSLDKNLKLTKHTKVILENSILGTPEVKLKLGKNKEYIHPGDTIESERIPAITDMAGSVLNNVSSVITKTDSIMMLIEEALSDNKLKNTIASLESTSQNIESITDNLDNSVKNGKLENIITNLESISNNFAAVSNEINNANIGATFDSINITLSEISQFSRKLNEKNNTLGLLSNDDKLYINLKDATENANKLLIDLKERPKRYVHFSIFGSKNK